MPAVRYPTAPVGPGERLCWLLVALSFVGDVLTTTIGLHLGLVELNPVGRGVLAAGGPAGMIVVKLLAVAVAVYCRRLVPPVYRAIVPAGIALPWTIATVSNTILITWLIL